MESVKARKVIDRLEGHADRIDAPVHLLKFCGMFLFKDTWRNKSKPKKIAALIHMHRRKDLGRGQDARNATLFCCLFFADQNHGFENLLLHEVFLFQRYEPVLHCLVQHPEEETVEKQDMHHTLEPRRFFWKPERQQLLIFVVKDII